MTKLHGASIRKKNKGDLTNKHKTKIPELINEIIESSQILVEILDSRFIEKTRNKELERKIKNDKKILIYVLNKQDLVNSNELKSNIELKELSPLIFISCKKRRGIKQLRKQIKIQAKKFKEAVNVGIIGYPNTGKSSIINLLVRKIVARISPEAGFTKGVQKIKLTENIFILDTPGVIPEKENSTTSTADLIKHTEIGIRTWDKVKEPEFLVHKLMLNYPELFEKFYQIPAEGDSEILIEELGRKKSYLKSGNQVDVDRTARQIIKDWQDGKIRVKLKH